MGESGKSKAEIILEYIKAFVWPVFIIAFVLVFPDLQNRKVKIGNLVEFGDRVGSLEKTIQQQLISQKDDLKLINENADSPAKVREYVNKLLLSLENAQKGVKKEAVSISADIQRPSQQETLRQVSNKNRENIQSTSTTALDWEEQGFDYLLKRDLENALHAFTEAEAIWPDFHNVAEIRNLLDREKNSKGRNASEKWKYVYSEILTKYSWGVPSNSRKEMQKFIEKSN